MTRMTLIGGMTIPLTLLPPRSAIQEWPCYGGDAGGKKYSSLDQINKTNVTQLQVAWTHDTGDFSDGTAPLSRAAFECTPLA